MKERMDAQVDLTELRRSLAGDVLGPSDAEYDDARLCFNLLIDRRPVAIARCVDAEDVATALDFAQSNALEVALRGLLTAAIRPGVRKRVEGPPLDVGVHPLERFLELAAVERFKRLSDQLDVLLRHRLRSISPPEGKDGPGRSGDPGGSQESRAGPTRAKAKSVYPRWTG